MEHSSVFFLCRLLDDESSVTLSREETSPLPEDPTLSRESRLYSGEGNSVRLTRRFSQDHECGFDLYYYPFDAQVKYILMDNAVN